MIKFRPSIFEYLLGLIILVHSFVISRLIYYPYPELFIYPYLTNKNLLPYKQILDQHFPGLMFLPINLNNLGMMDEVIARWWSIGIIILIQLLLYFISFRVLKSKLLAVWVCLLFLVWQPFFEGYVLWIDSFLPIMLLPAFYFTIKSLENGGKVNIFFSGLFLGMAIVFKQVVIPLAVCVGVLEIIKRPRVSSLLSYSAGILPLPIFMLIYYWSIGVLKDFWYWTVVFNFTTFAKSGRKMPYFSGMIRLIGVYLPSMGVVFIRNNISLVLAIYIIGGLAAVYARFDFVHLQPSLPFVCLASVMVFDKLWQRKRLRLLIFGYIFVSLLWLSVFYRGHIGDSVLFFDRDTKQVAEKVKELTFDNQEIFLWGVSPHLYAMTGTIPAGRIFVFQFPWFLEVSGDRILSGLSDSRPRLILRDSSVTMEGMKMFEFSPKIDQYISQNYVVFDRVGSIEFLKVKNEN